MFTSGGSESNELAMRISRQYHLSRGEIVSLEHSYHGATVGALSMTERVNVSEMVTAADAPYLVRFPRVPAYITYRGPLADLPPQEAARTTAGYLAAVREVCDRYGVLMIADEVMTGAGRTGSFPRVGELGVVPDMVIMAKAISGGYAPWARGEYLRAALRERLGDLWCIGEVRGVGLADGIEYVRDRQTREAYPEASGVARSIWEGMLERGFIMPSLRYQGSDLIGDFSILAPSFVISEAQIDEAVAALRDTIEVAAPGW